MASMGPRPRGRGNWRGIRLEDSAASERLRPGTAATARRSSPSLWPVSVRIADVGVDQPRKLLDLRFDTVESGIEVREPLVLPGIAFVHCGEGGRQRLGHYRNVVAELTQLQLKRIEARVAASRVLQQEFDRPVEFVSAHRVILEVVVAESTTA